MDFDFSRYPYRKEFPEVEKAEMDVVRVFPTNVKEDSFILKGNNEGVLLDFAEERVGTFSFFAKGNGKLLVEYGEWLHELYGYSQAAMPDWYETPKDVFSVLSQRTHTFTSHGRRACRYIRIRALEGEVEIYNPAFDTICAHVEREGYFRCSDELLNRIFDISKRTTKLCMQAYFEDGVKRDGMLWIGDSRVEEDCDFAIFGNAEIVRRSILYFVRSMQEDGWLPSNATIGGAHSCPHRIEYMFDYVGGNLPSGTPSFYEGCGEIYYLTYSADFLGMIYEYYRNTKDLDFVKTVFPYAKKVVDRICRIDRFNVKGKLMPRASYPHRMHVDNLCDAGSYYCALIYNLKNYKKLCVLLNDQLENEAVEKYIADFTKAAMTFMDEEKRMWRTDETVGRVYLPTAQGFAYLAGLCSKEEYANAIEKMDKAVTAYPDTGLTRFWFLRGAFEAGMAEYAVAWIKKEWGVLIERGATTCYERWDADCALDWENDLSLSACHGWSAGPACLLVRYILGVKEVEEEAKVVISPKLLDLEFAEGEVPTSKGMLYVKITKESVDFCAPEGLKVVVQ